MDYIAKRSPQQAETAFSLCLLVRVARLRYDEATFLNRHQACASSITP